MLLNKYANRIVGSDIHPYEVTQIVSDKTMVIKPMKSKLDPKYKMALDPGGFLGRVTNVKDQQWLMSFDVDAPTHRIRMRKNGQWYDSGGHIYIIEDKPRRYEDFNF